MLTHPQHTLQRPHQIPGAFPGGFYWLLDSRSGHFLSHLLTQQEAVGAFHFWTFRLSSVSPIVHSYLTELSYPCINISKELRGIS